MKINKSHAWKVTILYIPEISDTCKAETASPTWVEFTNVVDDDLDAADVSIFDVIVAETAVAAVDDKADVSETADVSVADSNVAETEDDSWDLCMDCLEDCSVDVVMTDVESSDL